MPLSAPLPPPPTYLAPQGAHVQQERVQAACQAGELKLLEWVFGNVVNTSAEKFLERRRGLLGERQPDMVMLDLIESIAVCWRHLRDATERKRHLEFLRCGLAVGLRGGLFPAKVHPEQDGYGRRWALSACLSAVKVPWSWANDGWAGKGWGIGQYGGKV